SPMRRTNSPRFGAGTSRQDLNASLADSTAPFTSEESAQVTFVSIRPSMGERAGTALPLVSIHFEPIAQPDWISETPKALSTFRVIVRPGKNGNASHEWHESTRIRKKSGQSYSRASVLFVDNLFGRSDFPDT